MLSSLNFYSNSELCGLIFFLLFPLPKSLSPSGDHFTALADKQDQQQQKLEQMEQKKQETVAIRPAADAQVERALSDPEVRAALMDPDVQKAIEAMRTRPELGER